MYYTDDESVPGTDNHAWLALESIAEVESWLDLNDRQLRQLISAQPRGGNHQGCGMCFSLAHGGEIYLHTNSDGDILLDVTPEAAWCVPVLCAVTQTAPPAGQIWLLPGHLLIELVLGLNSLIAACRLVLRHEFARLR